MKSHCLNCGKELIGEKRSNKFCCGKCASIFKYYQIRDKRLKYQREYDKKHRIEKRKNDKKRRDEKNQNKKRWIQTQSRRKNFPILLEKFGGCQFCGSKNKLEIHHKKYTTDIKDCLLLCQPCHKKLHRKRYYPRLSLRGLSHKL